jgi:hypothetical protein
MGEDRIRLGRLVGSVVYRMGIWWEIVREEIFSSVFY